MAGPQRVGGHRRNRGDDTQLTLRSGRPRSAIGPLDYDDSLVPGEIVAGIMHLGNVSDREANELGLALRWSYGSALAIPHGLCGARSASRGRASGSARR